MNTTATEQWHDNRRQDGVLIVQGMLDEYVILTPGGQQIAKCPCCNLAFRSVRSAKLAADMVCPIARGDQ